MIRKTSRWAINASVILLVIAALITVSVRIALPHIDRFNQDLAGYLSDNLGVDVSIGQLQAQWHRANPQFKINGIRLQDRQHEKRSIAVATLSAELDLVQSVYAGALIFKHLNVDGAVASAEQIDSRWMTVLSPQESQPKTASTDSTDNINRALAVVLRQENVRFNNASLVLSPHNKATRHLTAINFSLKNSAQRHQISGTATLNYFNRSSALHFAIEADELAKDIRKSTLKLYAQFDNLSEQVFALGPIDISEHVRQLSLDAQVWAQWQDGVVSDVRGRAELKELKFSGKEIADIGPSKFEFALAKQAYNYLIQLRNIALTTQGDTVEIKGIDAHYRTEGKAYFSRVALSELDLSDFRGWLGHLIPEQQLAAQALQALNPRGVLENLVVSWRSPELKGFELSADLHQVAVEAYTGAPALSGVTGLLQMNLQGGSIDLDSQGFGLYFPSLFANSWQYDSAQGRVKWLLPQGENGRLIVNSELLKLRRGEMRADGRFSFTNPLERQRRSELTLLIGMQRNSVLDGLHYIPRQGVSDKLRAWILSAAKAGHLERGGFAMRVATRSIEGESNAPSVQMFFDINDARLDYDAAWPALQASKLRLQIDNGQLLARAQGGEIAGNQLQHASVSTTGDEPVLNISAKLAGAVAQTMSALKATPVDDVLPDTVKGWSLKGRHETDLTLAVDLSQRKAPTIALGIALQQAELKDQALNLHAERINGRLNYHSDKGLSAKKVAGRVLGEAVKLDITTQGRGDKQKTSLHLTGKVTLAKLFKWQGIEGVPAKGGAHYTARFDTCAGANCNQLLVNSQLKGVSIDLPSPWGKRAEQGVKFQLLANIDDKGTQWRYNYGDRVRGVSREVAQGQYSTSIVLGGGRPNYTGIPGISVSGSLSNIDLTRLSESSAGEGAGASDFFDQVKVVDLVLRNVKVLSNTVAHAALRAEQLRDQWLVHLKSKIVTGTLSIPKRADGVIGVNLSRLVYKSEPGGGKKSSQQLNSKRWPKLDLSVDQLQYNAMQLGAWRARMRPTRSGYRLDNVSGSIAGTKISGDISWQDDKRSAVSHLNLAAKGGDFGALLAALGYGKVLESQSANLSTNLSWPGYPWQLEQGALNGRLAFTLVKGRVIEAGTSANFLRLFGLLNLNTVVKRLKLDFSDLTDKGVSYDKVSAKYYLNNGLASNEQPLALEGPSASVKMSGTINFATQSLEQKMDVAIPLTSNAPVAALLLSTPQVAAVAFIVDKLIGKRLSKLTSLRYHVTGPWAEPKISVIKPKK
ncbi:MAG: YhdP family protein [Pseudomonadales bacterium]